MRRMKRLCEGFFALICLSFSAFLLVLFLLTRIELTEEKENCRALTREIASIEAENELLRARAEQSLSLAEIERRALLLGLQPCAPGQIIILDPVD